MSPEEDRTRDAVDSEPKHYQLNYFGPKYLFKGRHGSDQFTKLLFESGYKSSVPLDANVSVEVVATRKSNNKKLPVLCTTMPVV